MIQKRLEKGLKFENKIRRKYNLEQNSKAPKIIWNKENGSNLVEKLINIYFDSSEFKMYKNVSNFIKYDLTQKKTGKPYEVKNYTIENLRTSPILYSELFKIATNYHLDCIDNELMNIDVFRKKYNKFIAEIIEKYGQEICDYFYEANKNTILLLKDGVVSFKNVKFIPYLAHSDWKGFSRFQIFIKI